ncbi:hypothetical protein Q73A0000_04165 [Kaistella flava (ex Peng et al. 2021)]|uniref:Lipoprotein n=1 Tax=Kaistella flava (ex Peng et al. 2021) TaxID=2038776 RepID=A0A7M2Y5U7_9FLAO|nr:DUF6567 family protein [Kaistella flava (ex Peng et al. 2021)]QOW09617.1 hypothetical protein Q73A0000_04165 [Kaistella flava (ex Peng et al. 2021)]
MKTKSIITGLLISGSLALTSCASSHYGTLQSSANLSSNNFNYSANSITGTSTATYIFGIGGMKRQSLVDEAKQDMLAKNPLQKGQALANTTVNIKNSMMFGIVQEVMCTITADVVTFN